MEKILFKVSTIIFLFLLSFFSGILFAGQLLGLVKFYYPIPVIVFSVFCTLVFFTVCLKTCHEHIFKSTTQTNIGKALYWTSNLGYLVGGILFIIVLVLPLILWPFSGIRHELAWDAGLYHLPKAAELVVSHSLLDLSIAYGEYPSGYEILVAFSMILNRAGYLIGTTHSLILVFFQLSLFLLLNRFSKLPKGLLFFLSVFAISSFDIIRSIESNPFQMLRVSAFDIGMNDFFLSSSILSLLVFSPIGPNDVAARNFSREGIGMATLLIIGTKPNGILVVACMWVLALVYDIKKFIKKELSSKQVIKRWVFPIIITVIGGLWVIRNLIIIGSLFNSDTFWIQKFSIVNNLNNPFFYKYLDINFKLILSLLLASILLSIFWNKYHWSITFAFFILFVSFCMTPTSAFFGATDKPAEIAWRFGLYLLAFILPVVLFMLDKPSNTLLEKYELCLCLLICTAMIVISGYGSLLNFSRLKIIPENRKVLEDYYQQPVGVGGYYSAYDYVRKTAHDSVVWVENGLPFYVFGKDLTNSISRQKEPDYFVIFKTEGQNISGYPDRLSTSDFQSAWQLAYEDSKGRVYKRLTQ